MSNFNMNVILLEELIQFCITLYNEAIQFSDQIHNFIGNNTIQQFEYFNILECNIHKKLCYFTSRKNKHNKTKIIYSLLLQLFIKVKDINNFKYGTILFGGNILDIYKTDAKYTTDKLISWLTRILPPQFILNNHDDDLLLTENQEEY